MSVTLLTKAQAKVLQAIAHNGWWPKGSHSRVRFGLFNEGLIDSTKGSTMEQGLYEVTEKGRLALAQRTNKEVKAMSKSFKPEVQTINNGEKWSSNSLRFATQEEALASANELASRWMMVCGTRASESDDPVTHQWDEMAGLVPVEVKP